MIKRGLALASASLIIHGSILLSLDRTVLLHQVQLLKQEALKKSQESIQFEFVEAPPKVHPQKPKAAKKISNRDALNQDLLQDKSKATEIPHTKTQGLADQLAQRQSNAPQEAVPKIEPAKPQKPQEATPEETEPQKEGLSEIQQETKETPKEEVKVVEQKPKPQVEPAPQIKGLTGQDKIMTQEIGRTNSAGASLFGMTSFEATGSGMGEYMKNLKEKIWLAWFPYLAYKYPMDYRGADAVISITLDSKGDVKILQIIESDGDPHFASFCMEAIQRASGFGAVPKEILVLIGKDELEIKFGFHYR